MRSSSARLKPLSRCAIGLTSTSCSLSGSKRNSASPASSNRVTDSSSAFQPVFIYCDVAMSAVLHVGGPVPFFRMSRQLGGISQTIPFGAAVPMIVGRCHPGHEEPGYGHEGTCQHDARR